MSEERQNIRRRETDLSSFVFGKVQPQACDIEEIVIGAALLEKEGMQSAILTLQPHYFYRSTHVTIFRAMVNLFKAQKPVDILTVVQELKRTSELDNVGGAFFISELTNRVSSAANIEYHAKIIHEKFIQRELIRISSEIIKESYEDTTDVLDALRNRIRELGIVYETVVNQHNKSWSASVEEAHQAILTATESDSHLSGLSTGFTKRDSITNGRVPGDLIIMAARPSMGKSMSMNQEALHAALILNEPIAIFSLEVVIKQAVINFLANLSRINSTNLRRGILTTADKINLENEVRKLAGANIHFYDSFGMSITEFQAICRVLKERFKITRVFADYIQLFSGERKGNREQEISSISRGMKSTAKELDVPVIALSQLSREVDKRSDKRPVLSDLRDGGAIEQDADVVEFLYSPSYYGIKEENGRSTDGMIMRLIAKNRNGPLGKTIDRIYKEVGLFIELSEAELAEFGIKPIENSKPVEINLPF